MLLMLIEIRNAFLIIFNLGIILRIIMILQKAHDDEQEQSPKKRIINHVIATIVVNLSYSLVTMFANYYR